MNNRNNKRKAYLIIPALFILLLAACSNPLSETASKGKSDPASPSTLGDTGFDGRTIGLFETNNISLGGLRLYDVAIDSINMTHVRVYQYINNIRMYSEIIYHFDSNGKFSSLSGERIYSLNISTQPTISESEALKIACAKSSEIMAEKVSCEGLSSEKIYWDTDPSSHKYVLAWKISPKENEARYPVIIIDALSGTSLYADNGIRY